MYDRKFIACSIQDSIIKIVWGPEQGHAEKSCQIVDKCTGRRDLASSPATKTVLV